MDLPELFNLDIFQILADRYGSDFDRHDKKNVIGWSSLPYGMRKIALRKIHGTRSEMNMKQLMGQLMNFVLQEPETLASVVTSVLYELDLKIKKIEVVPEYKLSYEVCSDQFLQVEDAKIIEGHIDTYTSLFSWELKTTWNLSKFWSKEIAPHYAIQLNGYLGSMKQEWGLVSCLNMRAFMNTFNSFKESSEKWTYHIPVRFNKKQFDLSLKKAELIFLEIDNGTANLECPVFDWECAYCDVRDKCGKKEIRCTFVDKQNKQCTKIMHEWEECLTDEFLSKPICRNCYENKTNKRMDYDKFKLKKMYPYEVRYE